MTLEELSAENGVSIRQIVKRYEEIGGIENRGGDWIVPDGTRYPARKLKNLNSAEEKMYGMLKATSDYRYIDHKMLHVPIQSFNLLVNHLIEQGWIQPNGIDNPYGLNRFDITPKGSAVIKQNRRDAISYITRTIAGCAGEFLTPIINGLRR